MLSILTSFPLAIGSHPTCTYARQTIIIISALQVHVPVGIHTANHPALHSKLKYSPPHILTFSAKRNPKNPTKIDKSMNVNRFNQNSECRTCRYPKPPNSAFPNLPRRSSGLGKREKDPKSGKPRPGRPLTSLCAFFMCLFDTTIMLGL